ncbi:MAG TPA: hypothetical protein VGM73_11300 [Candidatus Didemnitutus sp.]
MPASVPTPPSDSREGFLEFWDACNGIVLRGANVLRKKLGVSETMFRRVAPTATANVRGYFLYRVLDEAQKGAISLVHWKEFMTDNGTKMIESPDGEQILRMVMEETVDAQNLRCRKLVEVLVELVMFSATDAEAFYRDYFLIRELIDYIDHQKDRQEFFGFTNRNTDASIADFLAQIRRNEPKLEIAQRWYLKAPKPAEDSWVTTPPRLSSFRTRYKAALDLLQPTEFVVAGKSYTHAYSFSRSIHFSPQETNWAFSKDDLIMHGNRCVLLALTIISRCADILRMSDDPTIQQITRLTNGNDETKKLVRSASEQIAAPGDFVAVQRDLARVTGLNKSRYGFFSYEIEYISRPPMSDIPRDWFAGFEIRLMGKRSELLAQMTAQLGAGFSADRIDQRLDAAVLELWTAHQQMITELRSAARKNEPASATDKPTKAEL